MTAQSDMTAATGYAEMVDNSTPDTLAATLQGAADAARRDAARLEGQAAELRRQAAGLEDKPGMSDAAEDLLAEAARVDEDANSRAGMAAAFEDEAQKAAARRTG